MIDWQSIDLVIFDVDGTLYDPRCVRSKMIRELAIYCLRHPWDFRVLQRISQFRQCREQLADEEAEQINDLQFSRVAEKLGCEPEQVRATVEEWMMRRPLVHLRSCRYAKVASFIAELKRLDKTVAVLSDYPALAKLASLDLEADLVVSGVDPEVDRLKPHPRGLQRVLGLTGVEPQRAILIGDRDDRDGECARRAGVAYLIKTREAAAPDHEFGSYEDLVRSLHRYPAE